MKQNTINKQLFIAVILCIAASAFTYAKIDYNPNAPTMYDSTGKLSGAVKVWVGRVAVSSATGQAVDISSAGFTTILSAQVQPENNTTTATAMPNMSVKTCSTTSLTFNTLVPNQVGILGAIGLVAPTVLTGMYANVLIIGN